MRRQIERNKNADVGRNCGNGFEKNVGRKKTTVRRFGFEKLPRRRIFGISFLQRL